MAFSQQALDVNVILTLQFVATLLAFFWHFRQLKRLHEAFDEVDYAFGQVRQEADELRISMHCETIRQQREQRDFFLRQIRQLQSPQMPPVQPSPINIVFNPVLLNLTDSGGRGNDETDASLANVDETTEDQNSRTETLDQLSHTEEEKHANIGFPPDNFENTFSHDNGLFGREGGVDYMPHHTPPWYEPYSADEYRVYPCYSTEQHSPGSADTGDVGIDLTGNTLNESRQGLPPFLFDHQLEHLGPEGFNYDSQSHPSPQKILEPIYVDVPASQATLTLPFRNSIILSSINVPKQQENETSVHKASAHQSSPQTSIPMRFERPFGLDQGSPLYKAQSHVIEMGKDPDLKASSS
ncbi:hypothetical protein B0J11DRAFT_596552 [Dendryphion nanum]|uniref:Uncharacterized protein n=1 Tax=Dendryphion nanum TaxID=256645 RepID=A0A9P9EBS7_9PLEO|nr:hypothetical protein B0J11DRAFT_596552 [Dendryphion nanum]